jgi:hypothetical protein
VQQWSSAAPAAYGAPGQAGPPGETRSIGISILLAIVTLGIYTYVWVYKTQNEIKRFSGRGAGGPVGLLLYILLAPVTWFLIPSEVRELYESRGLPAPVSGLTGLWILLPLVGPFVWFIKVQGALNRFWEMQGVPPK